jgi:4-hydroxybenzoate polyprenyltransferase
LSTISIQQIPGLSRLKLLLALSRTPHGLLDMASPGAAAVLAMGAIPPPLVIALGLVTAFAGYTAVYALNDLVDYRSDREKVRQIGSVASSHDLDGVFARHPMAQGLLKFREGLVWAVGWAILALLGAYILNPICALIFLMGCLLEATYCLLLRISHLRTVVSGAVKTSGGMAAVFAVDPHPSPLFLVTLFLWLFFWEIGGQNVPNDWADLEEDHKLQARTIPVHVGPDGSMGVIVWCLGLAVGLSLALGWMAPRPQGLPFLLGALLAGLYTLIIPAIRLRKTRAPAEAAALFNRASYYPPAVLLVTAIGCNL